MMPEYKMTIPLIGVSDELFVDRKQISGLNWVVINQMRKHIQVLGCFRFLFFYSAPNITRYDTLVALGVSFSGVQGVTVGNASSEQAFREAASALEFIYAPTLCDQVGIPRSVAVDYPPNEFVSRLRYFGDSGVPYSKEAFKNLNHHG